MLFVSVEQTDRIRNWQTMGLQGVQPERVMQHAHTASCNTFLGLSFDFYYSYQVVLWLVLAVDLSILVPTILCVQGCVIT